MIYHEKSKAKSDRAMVLVTDIEAFEASAIAMVKASPKQTHLTTKFRKTGPVFTLKITDGRQCIRLKITKTEGIRSAQKVIASLMHAMTSAELHQ
jgi:hypothetical protein